MASTLAITPACRFMAASRIRSGPTTRTARVRTPTEPSTSLTITLRRSQSQDGSRGVAGRLPKGGRPAVLLGLIAVSLAGTADVAEFLATRAAMFTDAPGRMAGSVVGLAFWVALLGFAITRYTRGERAWASSATLWLAGLVAAGNIGLTAVHLKV